MFDSPLQWCALRRVWVALDEECAECARRNQCGVATCPLARLFVEQLGQKRPLAVRPDYDSARRGA